jgi:hypothetical protein
VLGCVGLSGCGLEEAFDCLGVVAEENPLENLRFLVGEFFGFRTFVLGKVFAELLEVPVLGDVQLFQASQISPSN